MNTNLDIVTLGSNSSSKDEGVLDFDQLEIISWIKIFSSV